MNKYEKLLKEEPAMKKAVIEILQLLNSESYSDGKEILDAALYFLKENSFVDSEMAKDRINSIIEGD